MSCSGCSRKSSTKNSGSRIQNNIINPSNSLPKEEKTNNTFVSKDKYQKCLSCSFKEGTGIIARCQKSNSFLRNIISDSQFKCPIKRF